MPWRADEAPPGSIDRRVDCARARDWIDPYLDELESPEDAADVEPALGPTHQRAIEAHLDECPDCRAEIALARRLRDGLREGLPLLSCPPAVSDEVLRIAAAEAAEREAAAVRRKPGDRPGLAERLRGWLTGGGALRPALAAAALVTLLLAAPVLYRSVLDPEPGDRTVAEGADRTGAAEGRAVDPADATYTATEIAEAEEQARMILAYVASVGRDAGRTVQEDVFDRGIVRPTRRAVEGLQAAGLAGDEPAGRNRE